MFLGTNFRAEKLRSKLHSLYIFFFKYKSNHGCQISQKNPPFIPHIRMDWRPWQFKLTHSNIWRACMGETAQSWPVWTDALFQGNKLKWPNPGCRVPWNFRSWHAKSTYVTASEKHTEQVSLNLWNVEAHFFLNYCATSACQKIWGIGLRQHSF